MHALLPLLTIVVAIRWVIMTTKASFLLDFSILSDMSIDQATFSRIKASAVKDETKRK